MGNHWRFYDLLYQYEKRGGNPHPDSLLWGFGETIEECGLTQLPMSGYPYTWEKGKGTPNWIEERLDKVLATQTWRELVADANVQNILTRKSDHSFLFIGILNLRGRRGVLRRGFRFEMAWLHDEGCREVVEKSWGEGRSRGLQECEDTYWRQRAKQHWLKDADANTRFYHRYASHRKKKNVITKVMNNDGDWIEGDAMRNVILDYYRGIFNSSSPTVNDDFFGSIQSRVTGTQNESLLRPFEESEVKSALFSMYPDKAPGPDGMNPGFYQHFWDVMGTDVSSYILNCVNTCSMPDKLNETNIILIPKKKTPEMVSDYRPIALSNVVYRVMAKMITARMKPLMENIISESQSAFISGRLITDNILIAAEVGHYLNSKQCGLTGWGALKLDMAKAYDRMEWSFLQRMLRALGFDERWIELLMMCVTTVSYSVLVNGSRTDQITPTRGLRQGDPLSPYLFIIGDEGLSILLKQAHAKGEIHGCRVARGAPSITHLFFADDSLLFFKANIQEAGVVKRCLSEYEKMSGQAVNYHKSNICYSKNTRGEIRKEIADILGVVQAQNFGKYLGLPSFVGRNRKVAFSYIEDKIRQRINSWNKKLLSQAGKEVLLKSVAQSMPTFSMSVFLLPTTLCTAIERTMNRYWWRSRDDQGIHWKAWDKLCIPKEYGGLGFKELRAFNLAMLGKQAWRFLTQPQSLVSRVYKARYYPTNSFYEACLGNNSSFCWRSIMAAQDLICGGVRRRIGDGKSTLIWDHPWLQDVSQPKILTEKPPQLAQAKVMGLMDQQTGNWDQDILTDIFDPEDVERILKIPVSPDYEDLWYWYGDPKGEYSVKSGYRTIVVALLYYIWRARNGAVWDATLPRPQKIIAMASSAVNAWKVAHPGLRPPATSAASSSRTAPVVDTHTATTVPSATTNTIAVPTTPQLPTPNMVHQATQNMRDQCYFDAAYDPQTNKAAVGAIILNWQGHYVLAMTAPMIDCFSPLMAEAFACKEVLSWLRSREIKSIELFTDCLVLQQYLSSMTHSSRSYLGYAIDSCRTSILSFDYCLLHYVPRLDNYLAHTLASTAITQSTSMYSDYDPPASIFAYFE
ncbi:PREDICTED: uncharacterized protein LOC109156592 [Ipomoea nil]|uniref:uncharacterized protein LOC109156592 n=1 Tax=Ipomoea nil TaxID=35883 RepID=UPI000900B568|nr:PREDICTED: uncharacterized protein LOC109156592 [Ipomoea nil]